MLKEKLAELLNGTEYPLRITKELRGIAKDSGLVIIYGASDDLMEFDGAIYDELGVYDGGEVYLTSNGILPDKDDMELDTFEEIENWEQHKNKAVLVKAIWAENDISWQYETKIPHVVFDIVEDEDIYCRGIIFELAAVEQVKVIENLKSF